MTPRSILSLGLILLLSSQLQGCAALAVSLAGAGAGAGLSHQLNGLASRTFTQPLDKVKRATLTAMKRMTIQVDGSNPTDKGGEIVKGQVADLSIEVELETLSTTVTRISVVARKNMFMVDGATAQELLVQTERALTRT